MHVCNNAQISTHFLGPQYGGMTKSSGSTFTMVGMDAHL
jgi:hypothetical protein